MKRSKTPAQAGFSLVETIAAMGILAMTALPLMQVASDATRNASRLETRLLARTVAENIMARSIADPAQIDAGIETGNEVQLGRGFAWTRTAGPSVPGEVQTLTLTVQLDGDPQVLAQLQTLRAVPRPYVVKAEPTDGANR